MFCKKCSGVFLRCLGPLPSNSGYAQHVLKISDTFSKKFNTNLFVISNNKSFQKENEPRLKGLTIESNANKTIVTKGLFTTCKKNDDCPPWQLSAKEIMHNKEKKTIYYKNAWLKLYDKPVFYFPKFFHPDPTVKRQSGFLQPRLNSSNILGSSLSVPYFHVLAENKDLTFNPILFSKDIKMIQNEYRQKNESSSLILDFGITNGFKSSSTQKKKNINHLFARFEKDLKLDNFFQS